MKVYKSMCFLGHEKQPVYTVDQPASEIYDVVNVNLPEGWETAEGAMGDQLICGPDGVTYLANDILNNWGDDPALIWCDEHQVRHRVVLDIE